MTLKGGTRGVKPIWRFYFETPILFDRRRKKIRHGDKCGELRLLGVSHAHPQHPKGRGPTSVAKVFGPHTFASMFRPRTTKVRTVTPQVFLLKKFKNTRGGPVPSLPSLPYPPSPFSNFPAFPSLFPFPSLPISPSLQVGPLNSRYGVWGAL